MNNVKMIPNGLSIKIGSLIAGFLLILYFLSRFFGESESSSPKLVYPAMHGNYIREIPASSPLIFPHVDHAPMLKEIGLRGLFILRLGDDGNNRYVLKPDDKPLTDDEVKKTTDQVLLVKRSFLDHGKLVYKDENGPEVVVVTLIDFDKYDVETLVKIVQNRVDYAQIHDYGVYIRWIQEFFPLVENQNLQQSYEYYKPLIMRSAFQAFPNAKHIFFVEEEALLMDLSISLEKHILDPAVLEMSILKNVPVVPGSNIRTYNHFPVEHAKVIIPQDNDGELNLSCFIVSTDMHGRTFLDYLNDPLIRGYYWKNNELSNSVGHILQWHPTFLGRTALVVSKLFASVYDPNADSSGKPNGDVFHYTENDLVASFRGCRKRGTCVEDINLMYSKVKKN